MVKNNRSSTSSPRSGGLWVTVGLAAAAGAAAALGLQQLNRPTSELAVAITSWPGYEYLYLAELRQLARPLGLDLRVSQHASLMDQRQAYERGDVQAIATTVPEALAICHERPERCPLIVLVLDLSDGADRVLAREPLRRPEQLLGRRVGLERAVLAEYILLRSLGDRPRPLARDVALQFDGPEALVQRLKDGDLDAIVTYHPYDATLADDPRFRVVFSSRQMPGEIADVLAVDPGYARSYPRQVQALVRTWWAAREDARRNPQEARALMAERQRISPASFETSERGLEYPGPSQQRVLLSPGGPVARSLSRMAELMRASGRLSGKAPLPVLSQDFLQDP